MIPERALRDGDIVRDAQTGRLWIVDGGVHDQTQGSTRVRRIVWPSGYGGPREYEELVWIPTHKLRLYFAKG